MKQLEEIKSLTKRAYITIQNSLKNSNYEHGFNK